MHWRWQIKKTIDFVFFKIFVKPIISSPTFVVAINFKSKEIVTQGASPAAAGDAPCVTISLDLKFIATTKVGDEIIGFTKILKKTKSMVFLICHLQCKNKIIATASGVWKILKIKPSSLGPGG